MKKSNQLAPKRETIINKSTGGNFIGFLAAVGIGIASIAPIAGSAHAVGTKSIITNTDHLSVYEHLAFNYGGARPDTNDHCTINEGCKQNDGCE